MLLFGMPFPKLPKEMNITFRRSIQDVDRFGGGSVMMWVAISYKLRTNLVRDCVSKKM
jgi:hypothetical protein